MTLVHHVVTGEGRPPIVFVHGFGCSLADWDAQVASLSARYTTIAVDLPGHGETRGSPSDCTMERYGQAVADLLRALALPPAVLVGHSMGCRVITQAALQLPDRVAGLVLVDGSQFAPAMADVLRQRFATAEGYAAAIAGMFKDMFTAKSAAMVAEAVVERAGLLPYEIGSSLMLDMQRYDVEWFSAALAAVRVPVMAIQSTYSNEKRERRTMQAGQSSPYLDMLRACVPGARMEVIADTGHFPQLDEAERTNALIAGFIAGL